MGGLEVELQVAKPALDDARRRCKDLEGRLVCRVRELSDESERVRRLQQEADMAKARLVAMESQSIGARSLACWNAGMFFEDFLKLCLWIHDGSVVVRGFRKHFISQTKIKSATGDAVYCCAAPNYFQDYSISIDKMSI